MCPKNRTILNEIPLGASISYRSKIENKFYGKKEDSLKTIDHTTNNMRQKLILIHPEGKIDAHYTDQAYDLSMSKLEKDKSILPENKETIRNFLYEAKIGKTIRKGQKKKLGKRRLLRYIVELKRLDDYFKKPFDQVSTSEMEKFIIDLEDGVLKKTNGEKYSTETIITIKKQLKKFYKWLLGNNKHYPDVVEWIDTSYELPEYTALSKDQVEEVVNKTTSTKSNIMIRNRAIIMVLFDSGVRAEELLNIRLKNIHEENGKYKMRVEHSKTKKRTLHLPLSSAHLKEWLKIHPARHNPLAQLFPMRYDALRMVVKRASDNINKEVSPHGLRHSSATYWAKHLSRYQLCYRMGWAMSSQQPDRYIDREGLDQEQVNEVVEVESRQTLERENQELNSRIAILEEQLQSFLSNDREKLKEIIKQVMRENSS